MGAEVGVDPPQRPCAQAEAPRQKPLPIHLKELYNSSMFGIIQKG